MLFVAVTNPHCVDIGLKLNCRKFCLKSTDVEVEEARL